MRSKVLVSALAIVLGVATPVVVSIVFPDVVVAQMVEERKKEADRLFNQGFQQYQAGQFTEAIQSWQNTLLIYRENKNRVGEGLTLNNLGAAYYALKNYSKSIKYHEQRLAIAREIKDRKGESKALRTLALTYAALGNYVKSIEYHEQCLVITREIKDQQDEVKTLISLGIAYEALGNYSKIIEYQEQNLAIARETKDQKGESKALVTLGLAYRSLGNYSKAIKYQEQGLMISRKIKDQQGEVMALVSLGVIYGPLGNYSKAIEYLEQSLIISRKIKDRQGESRSLGNLGTAYDSLGNHSKAIEYLEQSLAIARESKDRKGEGSSLINLGNAYRSLRKYGKAIEYQEQSLAIARESKDRESEGNSLGNLGNLYGFLGNYGKAIEYLEQSLAVARAIKNLKGEGYSLSNLGAFLHRSKKIVEAEKNLLEAIQIWESLRSQLGENDQNKISIFEEQVRTYRLLQEVQIAFQKIESALETSDRGRSRALVELMSARLSREAIEKQKIENLSIAQIQNVAKTQNATLIQYSIVSDEELYIYITQPNGKVSFRKVDLTKLKQPIAELVNAGRNAIGTRGRGDFVANIPENILQEAQAKRDAQRDRNLRELHQLLIEPIADLLPKTDTENVIFMPQGELFLVPFPALLDANNQPLITKHTILTAPSIQTLDLTHKTAQARPKGDRPTLVVGNPTMPSISTVIGDKPTPLSDLPGAKAEAETIATQLNTIAITGANAKKDTVVKQMQTAGIIHLATHGLLDSFKGDTPGTIALAPNGTGDRNDGLLTSGEIFDLKLTADLVVLSACDTGRGDITGDGVIGLSRSLFVAGVPSVIVSLWKVPDESTAFLMTEFYKNWKDRKLNKAQSLRQAMLTTRTKYPRPLDWAAFTLIGEAD